MYVCECVCMYVCVWVCMHVYVGVYVCNRWCNCLFVSRDRKLEDICFFFLFFLLWIEEFLIWSVWWRDGLTRILSEAFQIFLATAGGSNQSGQSLTWNNLSKATVKIRRNPLRHQTDHVQFTQSDFIVFFWLLLALLALHYWIRL